MGFGYKSFIKLCYSQITFFFYFNSYSQGVRADIWLGTTRPNPLFAGPANYYLLVTVCDFPTQWSDLLHVEFEPMTTIGD